MSEQDRSVVKLTYEDCCRIPEDGLRHEILDGAHVVTPAPNISHQCVLGELFVRLHAAIQKSGRGRVFLAPTDLHLSRVDVLQPDLIVILAEHCEIISEAKVTGTPDLVVEILSPSTEKRDRGKKGARYAVAGVPEYWIVDAKKTGDRAVCPGGWQVPAGSTLSEGSEPLDQPRRAD